ncbi:hypothetical protein BDW69DRAFT_190394 [Aspergillus filifer]
MDELALFILMIPGSEKHLRSLFGMRIQLMRQFKAGPDRELNDELTITPEYCIGTTNYIKKLFHRMIARVNKHPNQGPSQQTGSQAPNAQQVDQSMALLNASNIRQLQQQEEALQRARSPASSQGTDISLLDIIGPGI